MCNLFKNSDSNHNMCVFYPIPLSNSLIPAVFPTVQLNLTLAQMVRSCLQCRRCGFDSWVGKIPWRREWQPSAIFLSGKFHGQRSLAGYSPWDCKELDMTEQLSTHAHTLTHHSQRFRPLHDGSQSTFISASPTLVSPRHKLCAPVSTHH